MRPGRLDRLIYVGPPDAQGREEIFRIRTKSMSIAPDVDIPVLVALVSSSPSLSTKFLILMKNHPSDRRKLRRRDHGHLSGGRHAHHAGRYQRTTCTSSSTELNSS
jgi:SpoVK/Ycf46/Vps4 family AAA+-type ATPase